jgi:hypothetical protein
VRRRGTILRALAAGAPAGAVGGLVLGLLLAHRGVSPNNAVLALLLAVAAGCGFGLLVRRRDPAEGLFLGVAYGAFGWWLGPLTLLPLLGGQPLAWSLAAAQRQFASLLGFLLYGAGTGLAYAAFRGRRPRRLPGALLRGLLAGTLVALVLEVRGGLLVGPLLGLAQALEAPQPPKGLGATLVRGQGYGFLAWVAILGAAPRWSVEQARSSFPTLLACLVLGMAVAVLRQWLDAIAGLLSAERLRTWRPAPVGGGPAGAVLHGAAAGLLDAAGLLGAAGLFGAAALAPPPRTVTAGVTAPPPVALCAAGLAMGVLYGLLFRRLDPDVTTALGWGLSYGFLWWALGPLTLFPVLRGEGARWSAAEAAGAFGALPALLLFGTCLGLAFHLLQTRHRRPYPAGREPVVAGLGLLVPLLLTVLLVLGGA